MGQPIEEVNSFTVMPFVSAVICRSLSLCVCVCVCVRACVRVCVCVPYDNMYVCMCQTLIHAHQVNSVV